MLSDQCEPVTQVCKEWTFGWMSVVIDVGDKTNKKKNSATLLTDTSLG